jgi:predicted dehydrogenase/aryl-alcohol dehydrogenase-like predicted oxidoreductase
MARHLRWGIIGTGAIAHTFARGVQHSKAGKLVAVGSRRQQSADAFAKEFNLTRAHGSYEALLADAQVDAVYVSTPHPLHAEWAIKTAEADKHVLCEKPLAVNYAEAMAVVQAARENDVFLMEAFMYRCHPATRRLAELVREGAIGRVCMIQSTFSFQAGTDPKSRLMNNALGGGGILDVGCYPVSLARLIAGAAAGQDFLDPFEVKGCGHLGETNVDEWTAAVLRFPSDIVAQVATGVRVSQDNAARIYGLEGSITLPWPWIPAREGGATTILLQRKGKEKEEIVVETDEWLYGIEADTVAANLERRQAAWPAMSWEDSLGNMRTLDRWRAEIGLSHPADQAEAWTLTAAKRPLKVRDGHPMKYGRIEGLDKPISRLLMGADNQGTISHASVMFDHFFELGGNAFDTAYIYAGGRCEKNLGQWVKNHGIREQVVLLGKGAHTPYCTPAHLSSQLIESLERMQTDYVDIYMMHRDNPQVPVGEFVDVLNEHARAGRMRVFGGSNWSSERVEAANAYAAEHGLQGFSAVSNNFSLARMVDPVWAGCIAASDPDYRAYLTRTQMPLIPWSSQARGFFTDRAHPDKRSDAELVRCWYSEDNWRRRARAVELADKRAVLPINIALAYVLCQPFPTFPIFGPRTLEETRTSLPALDVELSPEELAWLNLE